MNYKLVPDQIKYKRKLFFFLKSLPEVAMSLPEGTATTNINNFIDAMKITKEKIKSIAIVTKHQSENIKLMRWQ